MSVNLTALIKRLASDQSMHDNEWHPRIPRPERDEIVLALRVLRVLRSTADHSYHELMATTDGRVLVFDDMYHNDLSLDEAERLLGIGGGE